MSFENTINNTAEEFARNQEIIVAKLVDELLDLSKSLPQEELIQVVSTIDMERYLLNDLGFESEIEKLMLGYKSVLLDTPFFATISEETLEALASLDQATYFSHASQLASNVRLEVMKGVIAGRPTSLISKTIQQISGLRKDQANVLAHTSLNNFSRSVIKGQMDNADENQKYVYAGVIDDRTRDVCLSMASAGSLTRKQITDKYGEGVLIDGGGFNCRHRWTPLTSSSGDLTDKVQANKFKEERKDKGKYDPITLEELYENKA